MIASKSETIKWLLDQPEGDYQCSPYKKKRTLTQNAYFHRLVTLVAQAIGTSNTELKNRLIAEYGFVDEDYGFVIMEDSVEWEKSVYLHLRPTTNTRVLDDGKLWRVYCVMKGTHSLNTKEMSRLVDAIVEEAKGVGVETLPQHELDRIRELEYRHEVNHTVQAG